MVRTGMSADQVNEAVFALMAEIRASYPEFPDLESRRAEIAHAFSRRPPSVWADLICNLLEDFSFVAAQVAAKNLDLERRIEALEKRSR